MRLALEKANTSIQLLCNRPVLICARERPVKGTVMSADLAEFRPWCGAIGGMAIACPGHDDRFWRGGSHNPSKGVWGLLLRNNIILIEWLCVYVVEARSSYRCGWEELEIQKNDCYNQCSMRRIYHNTCTTIAMRCFFQIYTILIPFRPSVRPLTSRS